MKDEKKEIYAKMMERLIEHFQTRTDVQNCLSKWYLEACEEMEIDIDYNKAKEEIYGMPYDLWKSKFQK